MDGDRIVEVALAQATFHRHRESLQDFVDTLTKQVDTDHAFVLANADQFEQAALRRIGQRMQHRPEAGAIHAHRVAMLHARLSFGQADLADRRMREHHRGDVGVVKRGVGLVAEQSVHQPPRRRDRHRRQRDFRADVADCVDTIDISALPVVDDDVASWIECDAGCLQADAVAVGPASGGEDHRIEGVGLRAIRIAHDDLVTSLLAVRVRAQRMQRVAEAGVNAMLTLILAQLRRQVIVETFQQPTSAHEQFNPAAERLQQAGKLDRDVTAADDGDAGGRGV